MRKISTTIKKIFYEMKLQDLKQDGYFIEYKDDKPFWKIRIDNLLKEFDLRTYGFLGELPEIVFLVGNVPHRFKIETIFYTNDIPKKYKSALQTEYVYALKCVSLETPGKATTG